MTDLKPCPFCGSDAVYRQKAGRWQVHCINVCAGTRIYNDKERPKFDWNRRVSEGDGK